MSGGPCFRGTAGRIGDYAGATDDEDLTVPNAVGIRTVCRFREPNNKCYYTVDDNDFKLNKSEGFDEDDAVYDETERNRKCGKLGDEYMYLCRRDWTKLSSDRKLHCCKQGAGDKYMVPNPPNPKEVYLCPAELCKSNASTNATLNPCNGIVLREFCEIPSNMHFDPACHDWYNFCVSNGLDWANRAVENYCADGQFGKTEACRCINLDVETAELVGRLNNAPQVCWWDTCKRPTRIGPFRPDAPYNLMTSNMIKSQTTCPDSVVCDINASNFESIFEAAATGNLVSIQNQCSKDNADSDKADPPATSTSVAPPAPPGTESTESTSSDVSVFVESNQVAIIAGIVLFVLVVIALIVLYSNH